MAFICPICQKSFSYKHNKDSHVAMIHEKSGRFECRNCDKRFCHEATLKRHERIHTGEKPFACEVCQRRFNQKGSLTRHLGIHAIRKKKKFKCLVCSKAFGLKQTFQKHFLVHSEHKLFKCDHCEFSSNYKQCLKSHQACRHSTTLPETSEGRLAQGDDRKELPVAIEQPIGSDGLGGAKHNLRVRHKTSNYSVENDVEAEDTGTNSRGSSESGSDPQDSDREPAEPDEESGLGDELVVLDDEDEQNGDEDCSDEPAESNESRAAKAYDLISLSSDDDNGDLQELSTVTSANLTVVYGVEYQAPDESG